MPTIGNSTEMNNYVQEAAGFIYNYYRCNYAHEGRVNSFAGEDRGRNFSCCFGIQNNIEGNPIYTVMITLSLERFEVIIKEGMFNFLGTL